VLAMVNLLLSARRRVKEHDEPRLPLEAALLRLARLADTMAIGEAIALLRGLPGGGGPGAAPSRPAAPSRTAPAARPSAAPAPPPPSTPPPKARRAPPASAPAESSAPPPPSPEPAAPPTSPPGDAGEAFTRLLDAARERSGSVAAWLSGFSPLAFDGEAFDVAPPPRPSPVYDLQSPKVKSVLDDAARRAFGRPVALRPSGTASDAPAEGAGDDAVDRAREMFDGEVI
ncbi:MAG: hypothetical protein ACF8XB_09385, partial [Planctomycetota bacterium JB042]